MIVLITHLFNQTKRPLSVFYFDQTITIVQFLFHVRRRCAFSFELKNNILSESVTEVLSPYFQTQTFSKYPAIGDYCQKIFLLNSYHLPQQKRTKIWLDLMKRIDGSKSFIAMILNHIKELHLHNKIMDFLGSMSEKEKGKELLCKWTPYHQINKCKVYIQ